MLCHWLSGNALFFRYISAIPPGWWGGYLIPLQYTLLSSLKHACVNHCMLLIQPPMYTPYTCTTRCLSSISPSQPASHLSSHINPIQPAFHISPNKNPSQPASHLFPHIDLHCLHIIYPPHIPTLPASHLTPPPPPIQQLNHHHETDLRPLIRANIFYG